MDGFVKVTNNSGEDYKDAEVRLDGVDVLRRADGRGRQDRSELLGRRLE
jgi:hypothetical protein